MAPTDNELDQDDVVEIQFPADETEESVDDLLGEWAASEQREYEEELEAIEDAERAALVEVMSLRFS